jgi:hypothetical protein
MALLGLLVMLVGIALLIDGLLLKRSPGPNPSWPIVGMGFVTGLVGWVVRRMARRAQTDSPTDI